MGQEGYKLKVVRLNSGEVEIIGNRSGLRDLAEVCQALSNLSDEDAKTPANHYHIADYMSNAEEGSLDCSSAMTPISEMKTALSTQAQPNESLDRSGGSVFLKMNDPAKVV